MPPLVSSSLRFPPSASQISEASKELAKAMRRSVGADRFQEMYSEGLERQKMRMSLVRCLRLCSALRCSALLSLPPSASPRLSSPRLASARVCSALLMHRALVVFILALSPWLAALLTPGEQQEPGDRDQGGCGQLHVQACHHSVAWHGDSFQDAGTSQSVSRRHRRCCRDVTHLEWCRVL
jgi:hypothetical protein